MALPRSRPPCGETSIALPGITVVFTFDISTSQVRQAYCIEPLLRIPQILNLHRTNSTSTHPPSTFYLPLCGEELLGILSSSPVIPRSTRQTLVQNSDDNEGKAVDRMLGKGEDKNNNCWNLQCANKRPRSRRSNL